MTCQFHDWMPDPDLPLGRECCARCGKQRSRKQSPTRTRKPLKSGRGFQASPAQREKVRGMACAFCGMTASGYLTIDPAHLCSRGMGGCDDPDCVVPLCRDGFGQGCHVLFDRGALDLLERVTPAFNREVAHAVLHLGLEGTRRRLAPSCYRATDSEAMA